MPASSAQAPTEPTAPPMPQGAMWTTKPPPEDALNSNDAYHALKTVDGLIFTGPTGTNVNDISVALLCP